MTTVIVDVCVSVNTPDDAVGKMIALAQPKQIVEQSIAQIDAMKLNGWQELGSAGFQRDNMQFISFVMFKNPRPALSEAQEIQGRLSTIIKLLQQLVTANSGDAGKAERDEAEALRRRALNEEFAEYQKTYLSPEELALRISPDGAIYMPEAFGLNPRANLFNAIEQKLQRGEAIGAIRDVDMPGCDS